MESTRLQKIERLLQKELSDIFQKQTQGMHGVLVSVSVVRVSPDLSVARAYLSIFPSDKSQELLEAIRSNTKAIRFDLGQRIRLQVRKIPELSFFIDDSAIAADGFAFGRDKGRFFRMLPPFAQCHFRDLRQGGCFFVVRFLR